jgi:ABC-type lipoprotein release transport system permease subunit
VVRGRGFAAEDGAGAEPVTIVSKPRSVLGTQLYGISPTDVQTYALVAVSVLLAAVLACLIPARRALRVSPLVALRDM